MPKGIGYSKDVQLGKKKKAEPKSKKPAMRKGRGKR